MKQCVHVKLGDDGGGGGGGDCGGLLWWAVGSERITCLGDGWVGEGFTLNGSDLQGWAVGSVGVLYCVESNVISEVTERCT